MFFFLNYRCYRIASAHTKREQHEMSHARRLTKDLKTLIHTFNLTPLITV